MIYKVIIIFLSVFLFSCGITDFEMPSWDVELSSIPLMNADFPASDLEGENIIIEDGILIATIEDSLEEATPELSKIIVDTTPNVPILSNIPASIRFEIQSINSNTSFRIVDGIFESGEMVLTCISENNNYDNLNLTFNQLLDEAGDVLELNLQSNDFTNNKYIIDLAGKTLTDQDIDGEFWLVDIVALATNSAAPGVNVGTVKLSIDDELFFRQFTGFITDVRTLDSEADVDIDYPVNFENAVILEEISLFFDIYNEIGFEFELRGDLVAYRDEVAIDSLNISDLESIDFTIQASSGIGLETLTNIDITNNDRINQMLRLMPNKIAFLNPTYKVSNLADDLPGFVSNQHTIRSDYKIKIPLKATFLDDYLIYPDKVHEVVISADNQELIDKRVNNATLEIILHNDYTIGGFLDLFVSSQELEADSLALEQAELQYLNYDIQVSNEKQKYVLELTKEDLNLFLNDKVYIRSRVRFHNSDGVVSILLDDNLNVKATLNISVKVEVD